MSLLLFYPSSAKALAEVLSSWCFTEDSGVPYYVPGVLALFWTLSNLRIWEELFRVCSFCHPSDLGSGLFIFSIDGGDYGM